jgi:hypothetical protein
MDGTVICGECGTRCVIPGNLREQLAAVVKRDELLGQWMFWASGVAFKSELGDELVAATDKLLGQGGRLCPACIASRDLGDDSGRCTCPAAKAVR